jgi:hypothetical protein
MEGGVAFFVTHNSDSGMTKDDISSRMWIFFLKICIIGINQLKDKFKFESF